VLLGNGNGTFRYASNPVPNIYPYGAAVEDFNADGNPRFGHYGFLTIHAWNLHLSWKLSTTALNPNSLPTAEFNGVDIPDLAVSNIASVVTFLLGKGDGSFMEPPQSAPTGQEPITSARGLQKETSYGGLPASSGYSG
jgi:hypothetical protein